MLGAPGAGKGTQAKRIAAVRNVLHVSSGDIFRGHLEKGTDLGKQVETVLASGHLVSDELTCDVVFSRLREPECEAGYVLDGFPRSVPQAEALEAELASRGQRLDGVIDIAVPDDEIVDRLTARRTCGVCGAIYNLKFDPPKGGDGTLCDREGCSGSLEQRRDDREDTIRERLRVYGETTMPLLAFYEERGLVKSVAGSGRGPDDVFASIEVLLAGLGTADAT
ncbi:MAG: adenylate kinase [bacterium]|nr:adenylate kinase [bacterium]